MPHTQEAVAPRGYIGPVPGHGRVVNVCFHGIGTPGRPLGPDEGRYWISAARFEELLGAIRRYPWMRISFDDGNASDVAVALPALLRHGLGGAFFVVADRIDQPGSLSTPDVRELVSAGMAVGLHGMRHRPWRSLSAGELRTELVDAREMVATAAARPVSQVACPFGSYDRRVLRLIRREGFTRVYTVDDAQARENAWLQSRFTVTDDTTTMDIEHMARSPLAPRMTRALGSGKTLVKRFR